MIYPEIFICLKFWKDFLDWNQRWQEFTFNLFCEMTDFSIDRVISSLKFCWSVMALHINITELKKLKSVHFVLRKKGLHLGIRSSFRCKIIYSYLSIELFRFFSTFYQTLPGSLVDDPSSTSLPGRLVRSTLPKTLLLTLLPSFTRDEKMKNGKVDLTKNLTKSTLPVLQEMPLDVYR